MRILGIVCVKLKFYNLSYYWKDDEKLLSTSYLDSKIDPSATPNFAMNVMYVQ